MNYRKNLALICKKPNSKIIKYYEEHFLNWRKIIITPEKYKNPNFEVFQDEDFLNFEDATKNLNSNRKSWYFQQFLKYNIVLKLNEEGTLIIDGDSYLRDSLDFSNLFYTKRNIHPEYKRFNKIFLKDNHHLNSKSFITNQMYFERAELENLLGIKNANINWIHNIQNILNQNPDTMFSEYQLYADFITNKKFNNVQQMKVFRRFDLINRKPAEALKKYDLIALEGNHKTTILRKLRAKIYFETGRSIA